MTPEREAELRRAHAAMPSPMSTELFAEIDRLRAEVVALRDDPEFDATDGAHPAWWRGHDYVSARFKEELDKVRRERDLFRARLVDVMPWVGCVPYSNTPRFTEMILVRDLAQDALDEVKR